MTARPDGQRSWFIRRGDSRQVTDASQPSKDKKINKNKKEEKKKENAISWNSLSLSLQETQTRQSKGKQSDGPSHRAHATLQKASFSVTDLSLPASGHKTIYIGNEKKKRNQNVSFLIISPERTDRSQNDSSPMHTQKETRRENLYIDACIFYFTRAHPFQRERATGRPLVICLSL